MSVWQIPPKANRQLTTDGPVLRLLETVTKLLAAAAALVGALAASGLLLWLTGFPSEHYNSRSTWRVHAGRNENWRGLKFNDGDWGYAVSPAPMGVDAIPVGEARFPTMWIVPDTSVATFRLTFEVSNLTFLNEAVLFSISDDDHDIWLNGLLIVSDANGKAGPLYTTDLRPLLRSGKNVIAICASDRNETKEGVWLAVDLRMRRGLPGQ